MPIVYSLCDVYFLFLFSCQLDAHLEHVAQRQILDILRDSLADRPNEANRTENEVRYKLIIDPSEDDSLVRLLFTFGVLDRQKTRVFVCSDFPGDTHLQKVSVFKKRKSFYEITIYSTNLPTHPSRSQDQHHSSYSSLCH